MSVWAALCRAAPAAIGVGEMGCAVDLDCSLNGECVGGGCVCDAPWDGTRCQTMVLEAGKLGLFDIPLAAFHGVAPTTAVPPVPSPNSTSWGASVLLAPEDGKYYAWAASMTNECLLADWLTNSEVVLAVADEPLGPFTPLRTVVPTWAHNPQAIRAPDPAAKHGYVYALFTLGDGNPTHGPPKNCGSGPPLPPSPAPVPPPKPFNASTDAFPCAADPKHGCANVTFTIFYAEEAGGAYKAHTAQLLDYPTHRYAPWDYGSTGNWNPAPLVHPNGTVFVMDHSGSFGWKHGEAVLKADTWRGPYRMVSSDGQDASRWGGSTANAEDPFMWIDKRENWHVLYEGNPMPGAHAFSADGITWSNISMAYDDSAGDVGCFNLSRPYRDAGGALRNVSYYTARPKLLLGADGVTPTHLYGSTTAPGNPASFTVASPLMAAKAKL